MPISLLDLQIIAIPLDKKRDDFFFTFNKNLESNSVIDIHLVEVNTLYKRKADKV
jgi:hypothetical protein